MKKQLLFFAAWLFSFYAYAQGSNDLTERNLKGKVKSVNESTYEGVEKFGEMEKGPKTEWEYREFNNAGYQTEYHRENIEKNWGKTVESFRYEDKIKLVEIREERKDKVTFTKIQRDPQGRIATVDFTEGKDVLTARQKYRYDAGSLTQIDSYNGDGSLKSKIIFNYNGKKQLVRKEWFDVKGASTYLQTYAYDDRGNLAEETSLNTEVKTADTFIHKYRYNEKRQRIENRYFRGSVSRSDLGFDAFDNSTTTMEYNEHGDLVKEYLLFFEEKIVYTYDQHNNWVKSVKTSGNSFAGGSLGKDKVEIKERQIKYY